MATKAEIAAIADGVFDSYDVDNSGSIDRSEYRAVVTTLFKQIDNQISCKEAHLNQLFESVDHNQDGKLSKSEFRQLVARFVTSQGLK